MDHADIKRMLRKHYEPLCRHKFDNLDEMHQSLKKYKLPQCTKYKTTNLESPVIIKEIKFVSLKFPLPTKISRP